MKLSFVKALACFLIVLFVPAVSLFAQTNNPDFIGEMEGRITLRAPQLQIEQMPSLFFTSDEMALISSVRSGIVARPPTGSDMDGGVGSSRGPRELSLGGIVYESSSDWTVWINGQKITPERIPPEILDIRVKKDYIRLKWFDDYTNQIFPVKLRPHQRFNIDTRIFLPG